MDHMLLNMDLYIIWTVVDQAMYLVGLGMDPMMGLDLDYDPQFILSTWTS